MDPLFALITGTLEAAEFQFEAAEEHQTVRLLIQGDAAHWKTYLRVLNGRQIAIYSTPDLRVPEDRRVAMAELIARANFGIVLGNFELDFSDGEIRYKTSIDSGGEQFDPAILLHLLNANLANTNRYVAGIMGVAFGELSPEEAVRRCEAGEQLAPPTSGPA